MGATLIEYNRMRMVESDGFQEESQRELPVLEFPGKVAAGLLRALLFCSPGCLMNLGWWFYSSQLASTGEQRPLAVS